MVSFWKEAPFWYLKEAHSKGVISAPYIFSVLCLTSFYSSQSCMPSFRCIFSHLYFFIFYKIFLLLSFWLDWAYKNECIIRVAHPAHPTRLWRWWIFPRKSFQFLFIYFSNLFYFLFYYFLKIAYKIECMMWTIRLPEK